MIDLLVFVLIAFFWVKMITISALSLISGNGLHP